MLGAGNPSLGTWCTAGQRALLPSLRGPAGGKEASRKLTLQGRGLSAGQYRRRNPVSVRGVKDGTPNRGLPLGRSVRVTVQRGRSRGIRGEELS